MKGNVRYGIVNVFLRDRFEKEFQLPYGYLMVTYNKEEALDHCRRYNDSDYIVEEIYDTAFGSNFKQEIYRSGKNEKDS